MAHVAAGATGAGAILAATGDPGPAVAFAAAAILIDLDHAVEYLARNDWRFRWREFLRPGLPASWPRIVFALHSHELLAVLAGVALLTRIPAVAGLALGFGVHLLLDEIGNRRPTRGHAIHPLFYFIVFRASRGFRTTRLTGRIPG